MKTGAAPEVLLFTFPSVDFGIYFRFIFSVKEKGLRLAAELASNMF